MLVLAMILTSGVAVEAAAQPRRTSDQDVKRTILRIEKGAEQFGHSLAETPEHDWLVSWQKERNIDHFVAEFVAAARTLRVQHDRGQITAGHVDAVLRRGASIDSFMERRGLVDRAQRDWVTVRRDLETLAIAYNVPWSRAVPRLTLARPD
jgi:hypothetical protein